MQVALLVDLGWCAEVPLLQDLACVLAERLGVLLFCYLTCTHIVHECRARVFLLTIGGVPAFVFVGLAYGLLRLSIARVLIFEVVELVVQHVMHVGDGLAGACNHIIEQFNSSSIHSTSLLVKLSFRWPLGTTISKLMHQVLPLLVWTAQQCKPFDACKALEIEHLRAVPLQCFSSW